MRDYIFIISVSSIIGGTAILLASPGMQKPVKFIAALCMLLLIISPFANIKNAAMPSTDFSEAAESIYTAAAERTYREACRIAEEHIIDSIYAEFGIKPTSCRIFYDSTSGGVCVIDLGSQAADLDAIEKFVQKLSGMRAEVVRNEH